MFMDVESIMALSSASVRSVVSAQAQYTPPPPYPSPPPKFIEKDKVYSRWPLWIYQFNFMGIFPFYRNKPASFHWKLPTLFKNKSSWVVGAFFSYYCIWVLEKVDGEDFDVFLWCQENLKESWAISPQMWNYKAIYTNNIRNVVLLKMFFS